MQVAAPPALVAWLEARRQRGGQSGIFGVGARATVVTMPSLVRNVSLSREQHGEDRYPCAHMHVLLAAADLDGWPRPARAAAAGRRRGLDRGRRQDGRVRPQLGLQWRPDGSIAGIDHRSVSAFSCAEYGWLEKPPIIGHA